MPHDRPSWPAGLDRPCTAGSTLEAVDPRTIDGAVQRKESERTASPATSPM
ncbi:hypothetical protein [Streptomyces sp. NPDC059651]|uniref:hypothetical protein n=1 Tax=Streptomyces sp. NPDC059651 TaxID=3346897 RepID=UPI0036BCC5C7